MVLGEARGRNCIIIDLSDDINIIVFCWDSMSDGGGKRCNVEHWGLCFKEVCF
jgi:hypothetical protein